MSVELDLSHSGKKTAWGCVIIWCRDNIWISY